MYGEVKPRWEIDWLNCSGFTFWGIDKYDSNAWQRACATWIPDQSLDCDSVHPDVRRSKTTLRNWLIKLFRIYLLGHRQIWFERHSTQKDHGFLSMHPTWVNLLLAFDSSMFRCAFLLRTYPTISSDFVVWPSLGSERKSSKRVRFESE